VEGDKTDIAEFDEVAAVAEDDDDDDDDEEEDDDDDDNTSSVAGTESGDRLRGEAFGERERGTSGADPTHRDSSSLCTRVIAAEAVLSVLAVEVDAVDAIDDGVVAL
jgi:hypothetical protein